MQRRHDRSSAFSKRLGILGLAGCLALGVAAASQAAALGTRPQLRPLIRPAETFTAQDTQAIQGLIHSYFGAFTAKNFAAFSDYFTAPFVMVGRTPRTLATQQDVIRAWEQIRTRLDHTDYATSKPIDIRVIAVTPRRALANIHWKRFTHSGALMSEGAEFYFVTKLAGHWKIDGEMGQQLALFGK